MVVPLIREDYSYIIGARLRASFAHPVHVLSLASVAGGIIILSIVRRCHDQHVIAVDVNVGRGRPSPLETHRIYCVYLFLLGAEYDGSLGVGVAVGVVVGVGVGVGVAPPAGAWIATVMGEPVLKKPTDASVSCGG